MKKNFSFVVSALIFAALCSLVPVISNANNKLPCNYYLQSDSNWELLGRITATSYAGTGKTFNLYVRVIGNRTFYQARELDGSRSYSITFGDFSVGTQSGIKKFNAKFTGGNPEMDYYINL